MTNAQTNGQHSALDEELCWRAALARDERCNGYRWGIERKRALLERERAAMVRDEV